MRNFLLQIQLVLLFCWQFAYIDWPRCTAHCTPCNIFFNHTKELSAHDILVLKISMKSVKNRKWREWSGKKKHQRSNYDNKSSKLFSLEMFFFRFVCLTCISTLSFERAGHLLMLAIMLCIYTETKKEVQSISTEIPLNQMYIRFRKSERIRNYVVRCKMKEIWLLLNKCANQNHMQSNWVMHAQRSFCFFFQNLFKGTLYVSVCMVRNAHFMAK